MVKTLLILTVLLLSIHSIAQEYKTGTSRFDSDWLFHRGGALGADSPDFDDSVWRPIELPHDWSIENLPGTNSPYHRDAISQINGGFTTGGTGWYRKHFTVPSIQKGKCIIIQFDGIYMNSEVWINGTSLGSHPYGYSSFWFDLSKYIKYGEENILAVKVRNEGENSRWYSGSGIYRHVWLRITDLLHVAQWGTTITSSEISQSMANVSIKTRLNNDYDSSRSVKLISRIVDKNGMESGRVESMQNIEGNQSVLIPQQIKVINPQLWSTENPFIYTVVNEVYSNNLLLDRIEAKFGIRMIQFDAKNGFRLNGEPMKLKGGCVHHDNGPLGAKAYDRAEERRVELLKASGFNAIRSAHNPPSPAFLDACDRLGMMVIDEAFDMWQDAKTANDYHLFFEKYWKSDLESMVNRDMNHPSIIMWSIGNEIPEKTKPETIKTAKMLADYLRTIDTSRPVTSGVNDAATDKDPFVSALDVIGYNYKPDNYAPDRLRVPERVIYGSESMPLEAFLYWMGVVDNQNVIGDFVWTAFDYLGEASIGWRGYYQEQNFYPWNVAYCGDIDICGWKRPQSYYRDALWKKNQLSVFVKPPVLSFDENPKRVDGSKWHWFDAVADWNWPGYENQMLEVSTYSSCDKVELFLNNKSLGILPTNCSTEFKASWKVPYQSGELKAIGYTGKNQSNISVLKTASEVSQIKLSADRNLISADGQDLSYITVELLDDSGSINPKAENIINFEIEGSGKIVAVGNANPMSIESSQGNLRKAWRGRCLVIVKSDKQAGRIILKASAEGLKPALAEIESKNK